MPSDSRNVDVVRVRDGRGVRDKDCLAVEAPLEIRLHGRPFAVVMRTPGSDPALTAGFLFAERVVRGVDDLGTIEHCRDAESRSDAGASGEAAGIVNVTLARGSTTDLDRLLAERRRVVANSSCGLCGRLSADSLTLDVPPLRLGRPVAASVIVGLPDRLRAAQTVFAATGGLHAAGLFDPNGTLVQVAEDVGRHNAVDKVIGRMLMMDALPLSDYVLLVSGRASFEIVQKAVLGGVPFVAAVSAPSSLAVDLADDLGVTLVGFLRDGGFNVYSHSERLLSAGAETADGANGG